MPDLPDCITTGQTAQEINHNIRKAIELHLEGLADDGGPIPEPTTSVATSIFTWRKGKMPWERQR